MNCPNCGAPMRLDEDQEALACDYCKSVCYPDPNEEGVRNLGEPSETHCPLCKVALVQASAERRRLLYCPQCRGSLIPMPVFVDLVHILRSRRGGAVAACEAVNPHSLDRAVMCPRCGHRMDTHYYAGGGSVVIDDCSPCELVWLDFGELSAIAGAPDHSRRYESGDGPDF